VNPIRGLVRPRFPHGECVQEFRVFFQSTLE
jgi:hypothetical protein